jgi:hypothetical protein
MKTNLLLLIYAVFAAVTSVLMLFAPEFYIFIYGAASDTQAQLMTRYIGALFGGLALMAWMARDTQTSATRNAITFGLAAASGLGAIVCVFFALSGLYNVIVWGSVGIHVAFCVAFLTTGRGTAPAALPA